jgi:hypothetical protein
LGISKDWAKKERRIAVRDKSVEEVCKMAVLVVNILDQFVKSKKHAIDHAFQDTWWVCRMRREVKVEVQLFGKE